MLSQSRLIFMNVFFALMMKDASTFQGQLLFWQHGGTDLNDTLKLSSFLILSIWSTPTMKILENVSVSKRMQNKTEPLSSVLFYFLLKNSGNLLSLEAPAAWTCPPPPRDAAILETSTSSL